MVFPEFKFHFGTLRRSAILACILIFSVPPHAFSQSSIEIRNYFYEAESWVLFEDYKEALSIYKLLIRVDPTNSNYKYRLGQCYLNIPGEKEKAIGYLEDAVRNINPRYKEGEFNEKRAPYDALYYLANAYRINGQLDKALETYKKFRQNMDSRIYDTAIVNFQIQSCNNAQELISKPLFIKQEKLGETINENVSESNPVVSDDERMIFFTRSEAFYDALLFSRKVNGVWGPPLNLNEILKIDRDIFPTSISSDGKTLYLYSSADYDGIIYSSTFENGTWSPVKKLNDNINTKYWESHATISHDGKKLYFTSNRKGSIGGLDIFVSKKDSTGNWGPAENLGPVINTVYNEESPFLSKDDKTLFFSSRGHYNMGGYDIFYSTMQDNGQWSIPMNVGFPLNSTGDDVFFKPLNDGYTGYLARETSGEGGRQDIYRIEMFSDEHPRKFLAKGTVKIDGVISLFNDSVKVSARNALGNKYMVYSDPRTGDYELGLTNGNYEFTYEANEGEKITRSILIPLSNPSDSFLLPGTILPKTDLMADLIVNTEKTISINEGESITFPLKVEPKSILTVEKWEGNNLLSTEQITVDDSIVNYKTASSGNEKIIFRLTDRFSNTTTAEVLLTKQKIDDAHLIRPEHSNLIATKQAGAIAAMLTSTDVASQNTTDPDPAIAVMKDKILTYSKASAWNAVIRETLESNALKEVKSVDEWLKKFHEEAGKNGMPARSRSDLLSAISELPGANTRHLLNDLADYAAEPLLSSLKEVDLKKEGIKTSAQLIEWLLNNKDKEKYPEEQISKAIAAIVILNDIPDDKIVPHEGKGRIVLSWIIPVILVAGSIFFFILFRKRKIVSPDKKKKF